MFAELGGLANALFIGMTIITILFAHFNMHALLSNRLYEDD
jgi:hypothetical protein